MDARTTWSVEPLRIGYRLRAHGLGLPEKATGFAWTRKGAERKALRWSRPTERLRGAYTPLPPAGRQPPPGTLARGRQPSTTHAKPAGPVPIARERPQPTRPSPMQGETGRGHRR